MDDIELPVMLNSVLNGVFTDVELFFGERSQERRDMFGPNPGHHINIIRKPWFPLRHGRDRTGHQIGDTQVIAGLNDLL